MKRFDIFSGNPVVMPDGSFCAYAEVEKRDARIDQLEAELACALNVARWFEKAEARRLELEAAIDKLAAGKGRYHTEANYLALIAVRNKSLHK